MRLRLGGLAGIGIGLAVLLLAPTTTRALPLYAARTGMTCMSCHVNPTGAGARNSFGFNYLQNRHSLAPTEGEDYTALSNRIGDFLSFGTDSRVMEYQSQALSNTSGLFLMQGAFYVTADLPDGLSLYYNNDLGKTRDAFLVARQVPVVTWLKVGKFKPPYGLKLDEHQSAIRQGIGFGTESQDLGVELGYDKGHVNVVAAVLNGNPGAGVGVTDPNGRKAYSAKAELLHTVSGMPVRVGGSYYWNNTGTSKSVRYGGYGTLHLLKRVTLLGEVDTAVDDGRIPGNGETYRDGHTVAYGEVNAAVTPRFNARIKYDLDYTVAGDVERYAIGGNYWLARFAELRFDYRFNAETPSRTNPGLLTAVDDNDAYVQLHVAF